MQSASPSSYRLQSSSCILLDKELPNTQHKTSSTSDFQRNQDIKNDESTSFTSQSISSNNLNVKINCDNHTNSSKNINSKNRSVVYRCRKCRTILASDDNVLPHRNKMQYGVDRGNLIHIRKATWVNDLKLQNKIQNY